MSQSVPRLRRAQSGNEPALRDLRIQALTDAPAAFGSTLERELNRSPAEWARWLSPSATFLLEYGSIARGLAAGVRDEADPKLVHLMSMWLHPGLRGSGAADRLVDAVPVWATTCGANRIRLDVIQGNEPAIRLYRRHGLRPTGHTSSRLRDGAVEIQMERDIPPADPAPDTRNASGAT
ncbi:MAG TPA: GNAT family N-acetyltransferase [Gemmatimonadales bacterium]|nr:GNAT family N-acetyltransferase [Gemmatimonadales bacterium]